MKWLGWLYRVYLIALCVVCAYANRKGWSVFDGLDSVPGGTTRGAYISHGTLHK